MTPLTLHALLALAERAGQLDRDARALGLSTLAGFHGVPRAVFDAIPDTEQESPVGEGKTWARAAFFAGQRLTFFCDDPPGTPQDPAPAQPGDVCQDCAVIGLPGALCPHHAAAGIRAGRQGGEAVVVLRGPVTPQGQLKDLPEGRA